jgi:mannose-6-phosphate isomerase-like protein (cupin superfamily)
MMEETINPAKTATTQQYEKFNRPWGYYENIYGNDYSGHKVKKIVVYPKQKLSLQTHNKRCEHWVIVKGNARVRVGDEHYNLDKGMHIYIPIQSLHRIENIGDDLLEFIETQIGEYLGEDDIMRYEDDYGRI